MILIPLLTAVCLADAEPAPVTSRPNIVLIIADDLGYGELGCYGGTDIPTPQIDSLAREGVRFTDGYVTAPFCAASRAGLLTGRYQTRFGFEFNPIGPRNADPKIGLPVDQPTFADRLRASGYVTSLVGKWHLGGTADYHPQRRGFDEFFGFMHEGHYFVPPPWADVTTWLRRKTLPDGSQGRWTSEDGRLIWSTHLGYFEPNYDADNPILRNSQPVAEQAHLTDALTREAVSFIDRHHEQPFCLCLSYNAVHSPLQERNDYVDRFAKIEDIQRRIFAGMLAHLDDGVGRVLETLRQHRLEANTLVIFLSDNGGPTRELTSSNAPLRGEKGQLYEGGIRVPFLMQWPARLPAGETEHRPVISLDLLPTILAAAGTDPPARSETDGVDLLPFLTSENPSPPHEQLYWRVGGLHALRRGDLKAVRPSGGSRQSSWELYDLGADISETKNLAADRPDVLARLIADWEALNEEMVAPLW